MEAEVLAKELGKRGLTILGVGRHWDSPDVLVVYLHGNAGQWVHGEARMTVAGVPGVIKVVESVQTPSILLVRVDATGGEGVGAE